MANPNKVWGQSKVRVDGTLLATDGQSSLEPGGVSRSSVIGDYSPGGFSEEPLPAKVEVSILIKKGITVAGLQAIDNATIDFQSDTGQQWILRNAWVEGTVSASDGKAKVTFMAPPAEEVLS